MLLALKLLCVRPHTKCAQVATRRVSDFIQPNEMIREIQYFRVHASLHRRDSVARQNCTHWPIFAAFLERFDDLTAAMFHGLNDTCFYGFIL